LSETVIGNLSYKAYPEMQVFQTDAFTKTEGGAKYEIGKYGMWHAVSKFSESVQCAMAKACDACADMGQL